MGFFNRYDWSEIRVYLNTWRGSSVRGYPASSTRRHQNRSQRYCLDSKCTVANRWKVSYRIWDRHAIFLNYSRAYNRSSNMDERGLYYHVCSISSFLRFILTRSNAIDSNFLNPSTTLACVSTTTTPASVTACACPDNVAALGGTGPCDYTSGQSDQEEAIFLSCPAIDGAPVTTAPSATILQAAVALASTTAQEAKRVKRNKPFQLPLPTKAKRREISHGAKFRRADPPAGSYNLAITGTYPCADESGLGLQPQPTHTGVSDPRVVSACVQNLVIPNSAAWSGYAVNSYLSGLLSAAAPAPTAG